MIRSRRDKKAVIASCRRDVTCHRHGHEACLLRLESALAVGSRREYLIPINEKITRSTKFRVGGLKSTLQRWRAPPVSLAEMHHGKI